MSGKTPQELIDQVIDHLHADKTALGICALVCRNWISSSRLHLYCTISLHPKNVDKFFELLNSPNCTLIPFVRNLGLNEGRGRFPHEKRWLNDMMPRLKCFDGQCIQSLNFYEFHWDSMYRRSKDVLLSSFPKLRQLEFCYASYGTFEQLAELLCAFPELQILGCNVASCTDDREGGNPLIPACPLLSLTSLEIYAGPLLQLLPWLLTGSSKPKLAKVSFGCIVDGNEARRIKEFLAVLGSSVLDLELSFGVVDREYRGKSTAYRIQCLVAKSHAESICDNLDLSCNTQVRCMRLDNLTIYTQYQATAFVQWLPLIFSRLGSSCLEEVHFGFRISEPSNLAVIDWASLADTFAKPQFSKLKEIHIWVGGLDPKHSYIAEGVKWIRKQLPECEARGILVFNRNALY